MGSRLSKPKKIIVVSLILAGVLTILYGYGLGFLFNNVAQEIKKVEHTNTQLDQPKLHTEALSKPKSDVVDELPAKSVISTQELPAKSVNEVPEEPAKNVVEMERIPFTSKLVEPGNPESYVDTYGQCPFYENAGVKGCVPPPDISCNEDWSVCEYTGTRWEG